VDDVGLFEKGTKEGHPLKERCADARGRTGMIYWIEPPTNESYLPKERLGRQNGGFFLQRGKAGVCVRGGSGRKLKN